MESWFLESVLRVLRALRVVRVQEAQGYSLEHLEHPEHLLKSPTLGGTYSTSASRTPGTTTAHRRWCRTTPDPPPCTSSTAYRDCAPPASPRCSGRGTGEPPSRRRARTSAPARGAGGSLRLRRIPPPSWANTR